METLMKAIAESVCAVISYARHDSQRNGEAVDKAFVKLGNAIEALDDDEA